MHQQLAQGNSTNRNPEPFLSFFSLKVPGFVQYFPKAILQQFLLFRERWYIKRYFSSKKKTTKRQLSLSFCCFK